MAVRGIWTEGALVEARGQYWVYAPSNVLRPIFKTRFHIESGASDWSMRPRTISDSAAQNSGI